MEKEFNQFKSWYIDRECKYDKDKIHHINYHWTLKKHPKKIDLLFELWIEYMKLKNKYEPRPKGMNTKLTDEYVWSKYD